MNDPHAVPGEGSPTWIAAALGVAGFVGLVVATSMMASDASASAPAAAPSTAVVAAAAPPVASAVPVIAAAPSASAPPAASSARAEACAPLVVQFAYAAATVDAEGGATIDKLAPWLVGHPDATVLVHGHADAMGTDGANLSLSRSRALAVAARLTAAGVDRSRLTVRGFGAYQPVEGAPEEAASNRRAVVYVKGTGTTCPGDER